MERTLRAEELEDSVHSGTIPCDSPPAACNLSATLESGQTFCWRREAGTGKMFDSHSSPRYYTVLPVSKAPTGAAEVIRVWESGSDIQWQASFEAAATVKDLLGLDVDLEMVRRETPDDDIIREAFRTHHGLRVPNDPVFPSLVAFICSAQMSVERIHRMQIALSESFGTTVTFDDREYQAFPTPAQLAAASEEELRGLKLGYRAPYVKRTAQLIADGEVNPQAAAELPLEEARDHLKQFIGVGNKVADCVLLMGLGRHESFPVDTWVEQGLEDYYPELLHDSYEGTSQAAREYFGEYAGYAQAYIFHYLRTRDE